MNSTAIKDHARDDRRMAAANEAPHPEYWVDPAAEELRIEQMVADALDDPSDIGIYLESIATRPLMRDAIWHICHALAEEEAGEMTTHNVKHLCTYYCRRMRDELTDYVRSEKQAGR